MLRSWFVVLAVLGAVCSAEAQGRLARRPDPKADLEARVEALRPELVRLSDALWEYAETALREVRSAALLAETLERAGFRVERGVAGLPTAFVATYGSGRPVIGILAEYDALPGVGNAPKPEKAPRSDGVDSGHGCGHNLFGAACVVAAIALKEYMQAHNLSGTIKLFGCPAEETLVGKVYMAKEGLFSDLDAALEWHPGTETEVRNQPGRAMNNFVVEFFGQAAHASADPWNGRSALDAVELMNYAVNLLREHVRPSARIHYVISHGGGAPNVVPEYAKVWYYVRDTSRVAVEQLYERVLKCAEGAAVATGTRYKVTLLAGVHEYLLNRPLQEALYANLQRVGAPRFSEQDQAFARQLQRFLGLEEKGLSTAIKPLAPNPEPATGGSTDVAEVSWIAPTAGLSVATAAQLIPWHSWASTACHGTSIGHAGALVAAKVLALTGYDLLTQPRLLEAAKADFQRKTGGRPYRSPVPKDQKPPLEERP
ncbi:MAG: amidohydrolase [Bacteroidota bacterium]|nr:amidohydrolase [Rhodothermia bacterium]MCS7154238.1 amidohydrolase [Bacteroidota bacterium]MDW8136994.1 amidohydrolase [Bacteroidota bacterium]MDW8285135.1 amidohydrolase [Bacteroidota bacterium]